ncbi:hypothetical protein [Paracoccus yeei]|uniref:hypothetical protein n=1 Tax=Paracoccus yeei TaxID=147645 RepID=UPI0020C20E12|nr:hypothetical protein [Paracoccus yeei]
MKKNGTPRASGRCRKAAIEPVAHRFKGGGGGLRLGQPARQQVGPLGRLAQASLHGDDGLRNGGHVCGELPQLGRGGGRALVGPLGAQVGQQPRLVRV